jgi:hypothetical protein
MADLHKRGVQKYVPHPGYQQRTLLSQHLINLSY